MFKNIFGRIWAAWGMVSFIITFLIIIGPSMCAYLYKDEKKGQAYFIAVSKMWMDFWLFLVGCSVKVTGQENFKKGENYVVVYNHNALLDVPLSAPYIPGPNKTIAKDSFAKVPVFGWFYKRGSVLVNRKSDKSRIKSLEEMKKTLAAGIHMCLYPEGTRNKTSEPMKSFYDGAFRLAIQTHKNIIPGIISGTKIAMPRHKTFYLYPTRLHLNFLPQVAVENETAESLKNKVQAMMVEKYVSDMKRFTNQ